MATINVQAVTSQAVQQGFMWSLPEAATQTYLIGAPLIFSTTGLAQPANNAAALGVAGIALEAGHNNAVAGAAVAKVSALLPGVVIEANCAKIGADDEVLTLALLGALCGISKRTIGTLHWVLDPAAAIKQFRIVGIAAGSALGDINARVYAAPICGLGTAFVNYGGWQ